MLSLHFGVLKIAGVWCPTYLASKRTRILYKCYSFIVIMSMYSLGLSQLARIIFVKQNFTDFNDTFFILLSTNFACFKAACILLNQRKVSKLVSMFEVVFCNAQNNFEQKMKETCDNMCRKIEIILLTLVEITALFVVVAPLYSGKQDLPYKVLLPYNISNSLLYWLTFVHHTFGAVSFTAISITNDAIITGFMIQICCQIQLLQHRLKELPNSLANVYERSVSDKVAKVFERQSIAKIVKHHVHIFRMTKVICSTFNDIIICQFCISGLEICVSVYQLSVRTSNTVELLTYMLYLMCMLGQFFVYCYFGNEVTFQSKNISIAIFEIDWTSLSIELKKNLLFMILRSSRPITMSCGAFVHMNLESFGSILKASYSAFSVLKPSM